MDFVSCPLVTKSTGCEILLGEEEDADADEDLIFDDDDDVEEARVVDDSCDILVFVFVLVADDDDVLLLFGISSVVKLFAIMLSSNKMAACVKTLK